MALQSSSDAPAQGKKSAVLAFIVGDPATML